MRPSKRASDAKSSSYLYCSCCGLPNSNVQDGCSMTPSSDMNSLTISLRIVTSPHFIATAIRAARHALECGTQVQIEVVPGRTRSSKYLTTLLGDRPRVDRDPLRTIGPARLGSTFVISLKRGKRGHHRREPFDAVHHADVRGTGQDGKLSAWQTMQVAGHTTSKQTEHLHRVLGPHDIGVSDNQQCRRCDRVNVGARHAAPVPIKLHRFLDESVPVLWAWSNAGVVLLE